MRTLRALFYRCKGLIGLGPDAGDLDAELKSHIEMHYEDNLRSGMPPKEARRQAFCTSEVLNPLDKRTGHVRRSLLSKRSCKM